MGAKRSNNDPKFQELDDPRRLNECFSVEFGDLLMIDGHRDTNHSGLIRLARRSRCSGIHVEPVPQFSDPALSRWAFKATFISLGTTAALWATVMLTLLTFLRSYAAPKCACPKIARLAVRSARPMA